MPEWVDLPVVQDWKGWSDKWLREWCQEVESKGEARKKDNGRWEIRYEAALDLADSPSLDSGQREQNHLNALARQLGGEA
jgi:hypothetical protein